MARILSVDPGFLSRYPARVDALDPAECVFLVALRWWAADTRQGLDPLARLREGMTAIGAPDAAYSMDCLMRVITRTAWRQIEVGCPRCLRLTRDEQCLLHTASLAQAGEPDQAEAVLRTSMLPPVGAEFALCSLEGLGKLLAGADLLFRRCVAPIGPEPGGGLEAWVPPNPLSLH